MTRRISFSVSGLSAFRGFCRGLGRMVSGALCTRIATTCRLTSVEDGCRDTPVAATLVNSYLEEKESDKGNKTGCSCVCPYFPNTVGLVSDVTTVGGTICRSGVVALDRLKTTYGGGLRSRGLERCLVGYPGFNGRVARISRVNESVCSFVFDRLRQVDVSKEEGFCPDCFT